MRIYINDNGITPILTFEQGEKRNLTIEVYGLSQTPTAVTLYAVLPNGECATTTCTDISHSNGHTVFEANTEQLTQFKGNVMCQAEFTVGTDITVSSTFILSIKKSIRKEYGL